MDLERSEVLPGAHSIGRHVDVTDEFLKQRLKERTMELGDKVKRSPGAASRWSDLETANRVITETLRAQRTSIEAHVARGKSLITIEGAASSNDGVVWKKDGSGGFLQVPAVRCRVVLKRADDGSWFVATAYLDAAK